MSNIVSIIIIYILIIRNVRVLSYALRLSIIIITIVILTSIQLSHSTSSSHKLMHCSFDFGCCTVAQFLLAFKLLTHQALGTTFILTFYSCCSRAFSEVLLNLVDKQQLVAALIWTREPE